MYQIIVSDKAKRQLEKLSGDLRDRIGNALERIRIRPNHFVLRLVGSPYFRLRVGDYRVILNILDDKLVILVLEVGHRRNIYNSV